MNIGIIGTRGIPNRYGGFEYFAARLSVRLVERGHRVTVFCSHTQDYREPFYQGVELSFQWNPEKWMGTAGQFFYDLVCNLAGRRKKFDVILHLGYTSDAIWSLLWEPGRLHITNMDGMEWQRAKYSVPVRKFLRWSEKLAAKRSQYLVADSPVIDEYLKRLYRRPVALISYGADIPEFFKEQLPAQLDLSPGNYDLAVARMEPENNIETMIRAKTEDNSGIPLVIFANETHYGRTLKKKYEKYRQIRFMKPLYDNEILNSVRHFSRFYLHGHSAGGTNPSLLEAMACGCRIIAHDNRFNRAVTGENALYFHDAAGLAHSLMNPASLAGFHHKILENLEKIRNEYSWESVTDQYERLFIAAVQS